MFATNQSDIIKNATRSPPVIGMARGNAASFNSEISADLLRVITGDIASNRCRIIRPFAIWLDPFYAQQSGIQLHFAAAGCN